MPQPLYTNETPDKYRQRANFIRDKMTNIRTAHRQSMYKYAGVPTVLEKCNALALECDNIADTWLSDTDYLNALAHLNILLIDVNIALDNYNSDIYIVPLDEIDTSNNPENNDMSNNPEDS
jgi:hypothetical protein